MTLTPAPLHADMAGGPEQGRAFWLQTSDDVRIRAGVWTSEETSRGTVLMFPGRTEYIEKYGDFAREMAERGFATLAIDWRGQGLADRLLSDPLLGHIGQFTDYQKDLAAALDLARELDLPKPWHLVAHSMGGAIGLRAVMQGLPVASACFSAPMWNIHMAPAMRPVSTLIATVGPMFGMSGKRVPSTSVQGYVTVSPFEDNMLTRDPDMYRMMQTQLEQVPDLSLGGPTIGWLGQSLQECRDLAARPSPDMPCLTFLGTNERIVDVPAIHDRMGRWPGGKLEMVQDAEHEVIMEVPTTRKPIFDQMAAHFEQHAGR